MLLHFCTSSSSWSSTTAFSFINVFYRCPNFTTCCIAWLLSWVVYLSICLCVSLISLVSRTNLRTRLATFIKSLIHLPMTPTAFALSPSYTRSFLSLMRWLNIFICNRTSFSSCSYLSMSSKILKSCTNRRAFCSFPWSWSFFSLSLMSSS